MPINKKIRTEIERLNVSEDEKGMLLKILDRESEGLYFFKKDYGEILGNYLDQEKLKRKEDL